MTTPTEEFFARLSEVHHDSRLRSVKGTVRFDLTDGRTTQHWHVAVLHGDVAVARENSPAGAILRARRDVFDQIVLGECNVMAATLRGTIHYQGDPQFGVVFRRLFGGSAPPQATSPPEPAEGTTQHRPRRKGRSG